jgi:hypothetical protein
MNHHDPNIINISEKYYVMEIMMFMKLEWHHVNDLLRLFLVQFFWYSISQFLVQKMKKIVGKKFTNQDWCLKMWSARWL